MPAERPGGVRPRRRAAAGVALALLLAALAPAAAVAASAPAARGRGGAVVSGDPLATTAGIEILRRGGNAVDGAVATALALAVVHPEAGNLGGGGFAVVKLGDGLTTLDFRETAPAAAHRDVFLDEAGDPAAELSRFGGLAAGVPGSPRGLWELHRRHGRLAWPRVVAPAIRLASQGFRVSRHLHEQIESDRDTLARFPETAAVWLPGGAPPPIGSRMRLPALARTLRAYSRRGPPAITEGPIAEAVARTARRYGGVMTAADLAAYEPVWREPVRFSAFGWELAGMDLPSSGGAVVGQTLGIAERIGWGSAPRFGAERAHRLAEILRRSFADRFLLGDPRTSEVAVAELLDGAWLDRRAASIGAAATPSRDVNPWPGEVRAEAAATTHLSVLDADGGAVALTTTINDLFGCRVLVPEAGFLLNNEMDDFAAAPGRPNLYGLVQGEANAVGPGKRMLSSMSPTLAWREGEILALGGRGGPRIPTATIQVLLNVLVDGDPLQAALDRPRIHHQWLPDTLFTEPDALSPETRAELERRGHTLEERRALARVHLARRNPDGTFEAAADPREDGLGSVVEPE